MVSITKCKGGFGRASLTDITLESLNFKYCDGKRNKIQRNKIRWLKVHITIRILSHRLIAVLGYHYKEPKSRKTPIFYINSAMWSFVL